MARGRRMVWAVGMAFIASTVFAIGSACLQRAGRADLGPSDLEDTQLAEIAAEQAREDTCAMLRCSSVETDEGLTFIVHAGTSSER